MPDAIARWGRVEPIIRLSHQIARRQIARRRAKTGGPGCTTVVGRAARQHEQPDQREHQQRHQRDTHTRVERRAAAE
jgi:hypothetical protein